MHLVGVWSYEQIKLDWGALLLATHPDESPSLGKICPVGEIAGSFDPMMQFQNLLGFRML